jgi:ADP-ribosylglycohydrolase
LQQIRLLTISRAAGGLTAANLGGDADTTAAIAGQLAGAVYGYSGIPEPWLGKLAWHDRIAELANELQAEELALPSTRGAKHA